MKHRDIQLLKMIISECKDIIRYSNEIGEKGFHENDVYQKATAMSLLSHTGRQQNKVLPANGYAYVSMCPTSHNS